MMWNISETHVVIMSDEFTCYVIGRLTYHTISSNSVMKGLLFNTDLF